MLTLDQVAGPPEVAAAGGKALVLARARRAGLPVPDGFVVLPDEPLDPAAIRRALAALGGDRFVARSSADVEDSTRASAAGVFETVVDVPAEGVARAIARVRASATGEAARAYLAARS